MAHKRCKVCDEPVLPNGECEHKEDHVYNEMVHQEDLDHGWPLPGPHE